MKVLEDIEEMVGIEVLEEMKVIEAIDEMERMKSKIMGRFQ